MDKKFVRLTNWYGDGTVIVNRETETLKEAVEIPADKDGKNSKRTRVTTTNHSYLVTESAEKVATLLG